MAKRHGKSPVRWFGGKHLLAPTIVDLFPAHDVYVEVFGGGGSVLFCKEPSGIEVYNDLDKGLINFFRVIRDERDCAMLLKRLATTMYSRQEYDECWEAWHQQTDPIERARQWFVVARMSFGAIFGASWGFAKTAQPGRPIALSVSSWLNAQNLVNHAQERLASVQVESRDFRRLIELYDSPTTLFYLDPPYVAATRRSGGYAHELNDQDHKDLVDLILNMQGHAILSGYASPLYEPLERAGYVRIDREVYCATGRNVGKTKLGTLKGAERTECIWHRPARPTRRASRPKLMEASPIHATFITDDVQALTAV